jgi:hypothetical protein
VIDDLFAPLQPPSEDVERPVGTIRGDLEGLGAGIDVWCGPALGWRTLGDVVAGGGQAGVMRWRRRVLVTITFDLGEAPGPGEETSEEDPEHDRRHEDGTAL